MPGGRPDPARRGGAGARALTGIRAASVCPCCASARSTSSRPSRCWATRSRSCTTRTTCPTTRWPASPGGPTCRRRRSCCRPPGGRGLPAADLDPGRRAAVRRPPTLGSAHAWLEAGGVAADPDVLSCRSAGPGWCGYAAASGWPSPRRRWCAPARCPRRTGPRSCQALRIEDAQVVDCAWVDNGPLGRAAGRRRHGPRAASRPERVRRAGDRRRGPLRARRSDADVEVRAFVPTWASARTR